MSKQAITLAERARRAIAGTTSLMEQAAWANWADADEVARLAQAANRVSSDLNGAAHRLRRLAKQLKQGAAAGAVHEPK